MTEAPEMIGFKRHLRIDVVPGEAVYLISEREVTALKNPQAEHLVPLLDGTRSLPGLAAALPRQAERAECGELLTELLREGLVELRPPQPDDADEATYGYWEASGLQADAAVSNAGQAVVDVIDLVSGGSRTGQRVERGTVPEMLAAAGLTVSPGHPDADLSVVVCADYLNPELSGVDAAHRAAGRPWLLVKPTGTQLWIGPVFRPGPGCWHCLANRLWEHRRAEAHVQAALGRTGPAERPAVGLPSLTAVGVHLAGVEAAKWLAGYRYGDQHSIWTFDSLTSESKHHRVHARPQCAVCGDGAFLRRRAWTSVRLEPRRKEELAGGHRAVGAEQTWARHRHLVSPITGVAKEIRRDERGPAFFNCFRAGPNFASASSDLDDLRCALRSENGGKGITPRDAEVSALCEAVERYSGIFQGDEERVRGSLRDWGPRAVDPSSCQLFADRQFAGREDWNAAHGNFQRVFEPFDVDAEIDWTPVWSLSARRHRLLPTGLLYFCAPGESARFLRADSNGNAAGSSLEDAVLQGMFELVERDAAALWWYNRTRQPEVDLDAFAEPWIEQHRAVHAALGREVWVLDLTSDLGIPVMVALSRRTAHPAEHIMFGFGAHLDPRVALRRALTELNQLMPGLVAADDGEPFACDDPDAVRWWEGATLREQAYLRPDPGTPAKGPGCYTYRPTTDLLEDVRTVEGRLRAHGLETLVLDQTRPDVGLPVVKVVVPGLRHFWARFGPGRLFDVPVRLGRKEVATPYHELNPAPLFV